MMCMAVACHSHLCGHQNRGDKERMLCVRATIKTCYVRPGLRPACSGGEDRDVLEPIAQPLVLIKKAQSCAGTSRTPGDGP